MRGYNKGNETFEKGNFVYYSKIKSKFDEDCEDCPDSKKKKIVKRKTQYTIMIMDIVVVILLFFVYKFFFEKNASDMTFEGMHFKSDAVMFENKILMSLETKSKTKSLITSQEVKIEYALYFEDQNIYKETITGKLPSGQEIKNFSTQFQIPQDLYSKIKSNNKSKIKFQENIILKNKTLKFTKYIKY